MRWTLKQTILVRRMGRSILLLDLLEKTGHISHLVTMPCLHRLFFKLHYSDIQVAKYQFL